jgi:hypothetical protein
MPNTQEIRKIVKEELGESAAHHFGLIKEIISDQFKIAKEGQDMFRESMERKFDELRQEISPMKKNIDRNSLDILALQDDEKIMKSDIKELKKNYA